MLGKDGANACVCRLSRRWYVFVYVCTGLVELSYGRKRAEELVNKFLMFS